MRHFFLGLAAFGLTGSLCAGAMAQAPYHIRGSLTAVDGSTLSIDTGSGDMTTVTLGDESPVFIVKAASIAGIQEGQFVGITSVMSGDERVALEVHIFEEALRGLAEGHCPSYPVRTRTPVKTSGF